MDDATLARAILDAVHHRGPGKTTCSSEVARDLTDDWRPLMPALRRVAQTLVEAGDISVTQKGAPVDATAARGPIRLGLPDATKGGAAPSR
ncbi:MAG: DUF3253 domain-containing protein [Pseudomonadota bacterium]